MMSPTPEYLQGYQDGYDRGLNAGRRGAWQEARREIQALKTRLNRRKKEPQDA